VCYKLVTLLSNEDKLPEFTLFSVPVPQQYKFNLYHSVLYKIHRKQKKVLYNIIQYYLDDYAAN